MSFISELKRRNVFKVGIAYLAACWLLLQIADVILGNFDAPDWVFRFILGVVIIGFPITLAVAWAFEITPDGLKRDADVDHSVSASPSSGRILNAIIVATLALAVGYFAYDEFVVDRAATEPLSTTTRQAIAVLPFDNLSSDPEQDFFADGLSEEILNLLARVPELKVIGLASVTQLRDAEISVVRESIGVDSVLKGSVRKSGEQLRINAQLIDAADGSQIWSTNFDRTMTDVFEIQDDVAARIIDALQLQVGVVPSSGRPTENSDAYTMYLKARILIRTQSGKEASELLLPVTELDPLFAEAWELLSFSYWTGGGGTYDIGEAQILWGEAATRALAINGDLVIAQALYDLAKIDNQSRLRGIQSLERAVRGSPSSPEPLRALIYELATAGYLREALQYAERFADLDPLSPVANYSLGETLYANGRTDEAIPPLEFAHELENEFASFFLPPVKLLEGQADSAITLFEVELERAGFSDSTWVRGLVTGASHPDTGQALLDRRIPQIVASTPEVRAYTQRHALHTWYLYFGFIDRYFELIFAEGPNARTVTAADVHIWEGHLFRRMGFTAHPRYVEAAEALGIVDTWEQRGPPDFCEKVSGDWICE